MRYYPVFLDLKGRKAVVIGGGSVAERKVLALLKAGAAVRVISPHVTATLARLARQKRVTHTRRAYRKGDIKNAFIVIAGTSSIQMNTVIAGEATHLVNVVDTPSLGNFIAPSVVKRGPLTIAISTEGCSPAVSKTIRREIEKLYGTEFGKYITSLGKMRKRALREMRDPKEREMLLKGFASGRIFRAVREKGFSSACKQIPGF